MYGIELVKLCDEYCIKMIVNMSQRHVYIKREVMPSDIKILIRLKF